jgi:pantetheine-phosphate adenylyltransferase
VKAIVPGSYDPITLGHLDIIERAAKENGEVYVVAFINPEKKYLFSVSERLEMMRRAVGKIKNVRVDFSAGRVVDYMKEKGISKIYKGYRNDADLQYEKIQAKYNFDFGGYETVLLKADDALSGVSSTLARKAIFDGDELSKILPASVIEFLSSKD